MSSQYVLQQLATLDISKATGLDNTSAKFLKMSSHLISIPLCHIFNIRKSNFPSIFKLAKVIPVFKNKGSRNDVSNYRPIAILPLASKILERHVKKNDLLYFLQSGFRLNQSCQTALTFMIDGWLKAVDKGELIGVVFLDLAKAFDLLDHELLLQKLQKYRFSYTSLQWFSSYLNDRRQIVSISNTFSDLQQVKSGVPQVSVLSLYYF